MGSVSVIVPVWNGKELLRRNLPTVLTAKRYEGNRIEEIILVDDASSDGSAEFIEEYFNGQVRIIRAKENRGFSCTVNMGVRMAKGELVCLLNQDVFVSERFLEPVIAHFEKGKVFAVSLHEKGYGGATGGFREGFFEHKGVEEKSEPYITLWVNGGSGVFRRKTWMTLKGFDEELFSPFYWEDIDICYRAQKRGYVVMWEPRARVLHEHESVINENSFQKRRLAIIKQRNQLLFIWKNITSRNLFRKHLRGLVKRMASHPGYLVVVLSALKRMRTVRKRRLTEIKESKISDEAVLAKFKL